jgi:hypothetical protein
MGCGGGGYPAGIERKREEWKAGGFVGNVTIVVAGVGERGAITLGAEYEDEKCER